MQGAQNRGRRMLFVLVLFVMMVASALWAIPGHTVVPVHAEDNGVARTPFMGWSTWSVYAGNPTESNMEIQANVVNSKLKSHGYNYIMLDADYILNPSTNVDQYGRWVVNSSQFPHGLAGVASYVHNLGLKFGTYLNPGIPVAAVNQNTPIEGTGYHARDIADTSRHEVDYLGFGGNSMYYIDYSKPGAQAYLCRSKERTISTILILLCNMRFHLTSQVILGRLTNYGY